MRDTKTGRSASFRIVTLEREYGCGAAGIAEKLATRLGWTLWDQRLTQEIARLAHSEKSAVETREERRDPLYYRLFKSFALGSYEGSPGVPVETLDADSISEFPRVWSNKRRPRATASSWGGAHNTSCELAAIHCAFFSMPLEEKNYDVLLPRARQKSMRECWWMLSTVSGLLSSRCTSMSIGPTARSTTLCSIPRQGTTP